MGLRDGLDAVADRAATALSSLFVTAPDHPGSGGVTGADSPADDQADERSDDTDERDRENGA